MQNFVQYAPTEVIFGKDTEKRDGCRGEKMGRQPGATGLWRRKRGSGAA